MHLYKYLIAIVGYFACISNNLWLHIKSIELAKSMFQLLRNSWNLDIVKACYYFELARENTRKYPLGLDNTFILTC
jgi:hypothetical protein